MKIIGDFEKRVINESGRIETTLVVTDYRSKECIKELDLSKEYRITIEEVKSTRTLEQNRLMWDIIHSIGTARGSDRANDDWNIYLECLERAGAKCEYIAVLPSAVDLIKKQFRAVKEMNEFEQNGNVFQVLKVYYGSSKMNTKEMSNLLETVKDVAIESGVEDYWESQL